MTKLKSKIQKALDDYRPTIEITDYTDLDILYFIIYIPESDTVYCHEYHISEEVKCMNNNWLAVSWPLRIPDKLIIDKFITIIKKRVVNGHLIPKE